ncbi:hypothetical protein TELCIR_09842 [Teladorsagia circumcincta]|uniref:Uncharacterized protein n=1 Tax=Teladorsagia circumcincta TaxID=45464 RepID=A0A2G9UDQ5_TELCI|nr:hypothetical protein TELCIR_09842 [Teladorsagia circumcincta]
MRHSSTSCSEASPAEENGGGVSEEHNEERDIDESTKDTELDDTGLCPKCGSSEDPQFIHYKKIVKVPLSKCRNSASSKPKDAVPRASSKRQQNNSSDSTKLDLNAAPKKLRKGYVYEVVPVEPPPRKSLDINSLIVNGHGLPNTNECGTQTMGGAHFFSMLIDQLVNGQAGLCAGLSTDEPITLPSYVSRRLMISQQLIKRQSDELNRVQDENKRLHAVANLMNSVIKKFGDEYTSELRRLRDTIEVLKREFSFYQEEFVAEAKKSIDNILLKISLQDNPLLQAVPPYLARMENLAHRLIQASVPVPVKKSLPFNGPVITDSSMCKQGASKVSPGSAKDFRTKGIAKGGVKAPEESTRFDGKLDE